MIRRLSNALDYTGPVLGGVASWAHCLLDVEWLVRWLRDNKEHEPEPMA